MYFALVALLIFFPYLFAEELVSNEQPDAGQEIRESIEKVLKEKLTTECPTGIRNFQQTISFDFKDTPLETIIRQISFEKRINIILPQGDQALQQKITYRIPGKLSVDRAWKELNVILEYAGYTWTAEQNGHISLLKVIKDSIQREDLPLFINPPLEDIPNTGAIIQGIFYLSNLKVSDPKVKQVLVDTILVGNPQSPGMLTETAKVIPIEKQNGILIIDEAHNIQAAMQIIQALDLAGIPDAIEVVPLYYTEAQFVSTIFNDKILQRETATPGFTTPKQADEIEAAYFPKNTRVAPLLRTNAIVIMGTTKGIRTVKDFIIKYIDHPLESGDSILHVYDLQYLNAEDFAGVLEKLVKGQPNGNAQSESQQKAIGTERDFIGVIIRAEKTTIKSILRTKPGEAAQIKPSEAAKSGEAAGTLEGEGVETGGNRLVIAATKKDWRRIKDLIRKLDKPQPQVALEVLVVDLILRDDKQLGSQLRNNSGANDALSQNLNFQTAHLGAPVLIPGDPAAINVDPPGAGTIPNFPANALMANLLQFISGTATNLGNTQELGSTIISIRDPNNSGIWNIWQILDRTTNATMLAQPFITTLDNQQATITLSEERLLVGGANSDGGAVSVQNNYIPASTAIDILPRISIENNNINLDIVINVNEYIDDQTLADGSTPNNTRITRVVQTNANVGNNEILAIGGLIRYTDNTVITKTPLLGSIPVIGWFFKRKSKIRQKNNLMVFISPTIIEPRRGGGVGKYSSSKLCRAKNEIDESINFQSLRDPITRWFFQPDVGYGSRVINDYVEQKVFDEPFDPDSSRVLVKNEAQSAQQAKNSFRLAQKKKPHASKNTITVAQKDQAPRKPNQEKDIRFLAKNAENPLLRAKDRKNQGVLNS